MDFSGRIEKILSERKIIKNLTIRNVKIKYKDTWLGFVWAFLQPFCTIMILYFVFSQVFETNIKLFPLYLCTGVIPWVFFSNALAEATGSLLNNSNLAHKINFTLEIIPFSYCLLSLIDFIFALCILAPVLFCFGVVINFPVFLMIIPLSFLMLIFSCGLSFLLSALNVFFKDVAHLLQVVLMFWFYLTPIFYSVDNLNPSLKKIYVFNPMTHFIGAYRDVMFYAKMPEIKTWSIMLCLALVAFCVGWTFFVKHEKEMVKEL